MNKYNPAYFDKIINPALAQTAMRGAEPHGEFKVYVRLAKPDQRPSYMKVLGFYAPGLLKARIPCDQIARVADDSNVVSVELREHVSGALAS